MARDGLDESERSGSEFRRRVYIAQWMYSKTDKVWSQMESVGALIRKIRIFLSVVPCTPFARAADLLNGEG
jgi:hypothetical protein